MLDLLRREAEQEYLYPDQIRIDGGTQMRAGLNSDTVTEYLDAITGPNDWPFPPVIVFYDGSVYWLGDGFHRVEAGRRYAEREQIRYSIPAEVRSGTRRDAILYAAGANATHGLRRTNADKRRAVETLLRDQEWGQWSDREIARRCEVSNRFVSNLRAEIVTVNGSQSEPAERTYTTRHGTTATMNVTGQRQAAQQRTETTTERLKRYSADAAAIRAQQSPPTGLAAMEADLRAGMTQQPATVVEVVEDDEPDQVLTFEPKARIPATLVVEAERDPFGPFALTPNPDPLAPEFTARQRRQMELEDQVDFWVEALGRLSQIGNLTSVYSHEAPLRRAIEPALETLRKELRG